MMLNLMMNKWKLESDIYIHSFQDNCVSDNIFDKYCCNYKDQFYSVYYYKLNQLMKKIDRLPNPCDSQTSETDYSRFPNIFQYNQRSKMAFLSDSEQSQYIQPQKFNNPPKTIKIKLQQIVPKQQQVVLDEQQQQIANALTECLYVNKQSFHKKQLLPLSKASVVIQQQGSQNSIINDLAECIKTESESSEKMKFKKKKIFDIKHKNPQKQKLSQQKTQNINYDTNTIRKQRKLIFNQRARQRIAQVSQFNIQGSEEPTVRQCKHMQYMLKSLNIIDKLTVHAEKQKQHEQLYAKTVKQKIIEIKIDIDKINTLTLEQLVGQEKQLIKYLFLSSEQLRKRIYQDGISDKQTLQSIQNINRHINLIKHVKDKYLFTQNLLQQLSQEITNILDQEAPKQYLTLKSTNQAIQHISNQQKVLSDELKIEKRLLEYYKKQKQQLIETYQWLKNILIHPIQ